MDFITRAEWRAAPPKAPYIRIGTCDYFFVHHSGDNWTSSTDVEKSKAHMRAIQLSHMNGADNQRDIGYSWAIDDAGRIYEGRGWFAAGGHTYGWNSISYGCVYLGDTRFSTPSQDALRAFKVVYNDGVLKGALTPDAAILGHRDGVATLCPGEVLYNAIPYIKSLNVNVTEAEEMLTPEQAQYLVIAATNAQAANNAIQNAHLTEQIINALTAKGIGDKGDNPVAVDLKNVPTVSLIAELANRVK